MNNIGALNNGKKADVTIAICQAGYNSKDKKTAVAIAAGGKLTETTYQIVREKDGASVYEGTLYIFKPKNWTREEFYYEIDFSSFTTPGIYKIKINDSESFAFSIEANAWAKHVGDVIGYYRIQRCGEDTEAALPAEGFPNRPDKEALHPPCHMDDAKVGSPDGDIADCTGGWHDAGDNNKYNSQFGWLAAALVSTYFRHPKAVFDLDRNGVPDLLDEARVAAEYLLKVQKASNNDGGLLDQVQNHGKCCVWLHPFAETDGIKGNADDRVLENRPTSRDRNPPLFPYDTSMKAAAGLAAVSRAFWTIDRPFAEECRKGAIKAYNWALKNTDKVRGSYCTDIQDYSRLLAAVELFLLTQEEKYGSYVDSYIDSCESISNRGTNYWGAEPLALADYFNAAGKRRDKIIKLLTNAVNNWITSLEQPFGISNDITNCNFGINEPNMSKAADAYRLYELTGDTKARDAAIKAMEWTFGVNPFNISFVGGIGQHFPLRIHSRLDTDAETNPDSTIYLPGFMVCGPISHDTLDEDSVSPWYMDRPLAQDNLKQWRYNEHSVSIQFACLDLVIAQAYGN